MDAVLQKSMDMTVELSETGKNGRPSFPIATIRATQVSSSPVDQDNKNNNSVLISGELLLLFLHFSITIFISSFSESLIWICILIGKKCLTDRGIGNEYSDEDEDQEFSSNEDNDDGLSGYAAKRNYASKRDNYRKLERNENDAEADENLGGAQGDSDSDFEVKVKGSRANKMSRVSFESLHNSITSQICENGNSFPFVFYPHPSTYLSHIQQRNFKQKIVALLKRFRPEELEGDVRRGQGGLRGERDLDALFQELESLSCGEGEESGQDIDSISIGSTPKPSLRPFFNSKQDNVMGEFVKNHFDVCWFIA